MDAKLKKLWIDALESGDYKQAQSTLKNFEGYCCLGVFVDVCVKNGMVPEGIPVAVYDSYMEIGGRGAADPTVSSGYLGQGNLYAPAFGLDEKLATELAGMNDSGFTFKGIADHIRAHVSTS